MDAGDDAGAATATAGGAVGAGSEMSGVVAVVSGDAPIAEVRRMVNGAGGR